MTRVKFTEKTPEMIEAINRYSSRNYARLPVVLSTGRNATFVDVEGNRFIDMMSCYSAENIGHVNPEVTRAAVKQMYRLANCSQKFYTDIEFEYKRLLCSLCDMEVMMPANSGVEAWEGAAKIVRRWGYEEKGVEEAEIIICEDNFHGRTIAAISASTNKKYQKNFGPLLSGFVSIPFGDSGALEKAINLNTAGFIIEPIQGEAGIIVPPFGFLSDVRRICTDHNVLFIADEIQTGWGRTGKIFACDHEYIRPDMYILGKALGGGILPVSAVVTSREIMDVMDPGSHGSTFAGSPLSCAVALAGLEFMLKEKLPERAKALGGYFFKKLLQIDSPYVKEIRGKGLFIGVEFKEKAKRFVEALFWSGVLTTETQDNVIRFAPPLTIIQEEIDEALVGIDYVLSGKHFHHN
ncbi:ornithine--oxo-acid transaminase [Patescibacteria group bacterium]